MESKFDENDLRKPTTVLFLTTENLINFYLLKKEKIALPESKVF